MKEFIIGRNDAGQRLDRFVSKAAPLIPESLLQKTLRKKDIKINGRPAKGEARRAPPPDGSRGISSRTRRTIRSMSTIRRAPGRKPP